jgi:hypothetical protein
MHYAAIRLSPGECSAPYDAGWRYAEWFLGKGGDVIADPSCNWSDEKANGFCDRLALERRARDAGASAGAGYFIDPTGALRRTDEPELAGTLEVDLTAGTVLFLHGESPSGRSAPLFERPPVPGEEAKGATT